MAGSGFISQHSKTLLFGLGTSTRVRRSPSSGRAGHAQSLPDAAPRSPVLVTENSDQVADRTVRNGTFHRQSPVSVLPSTSALAAASARRGLSEPFPAPDFTLRDLDGLEHSLAGLAGRPAALLFWATWAPPSRAALSRRSPRNVTRWPGPGSHCSRCRSMPPRTNPRCGRPPRASVCRADRRRCCRRHLHDSPSVSLRSPPRPAVAARSW